MLAVGCCSDSVTSAVTALPPALRSAAPRSRRSPPHRSRTSCRSPSGRCSADRPAARPARSTGAVGRALRRRRTASTASVAASTAVATASPAIAAASASSASVGVVGGGERRVVGGESCRRRRRRVVPCLLKLPSLVVLPTETSPTVTSTSESMRFASSPAAIASSPEATTASWSKICVTSPPSVQMFWFVDWSTMVVRASIEVNWLMIRVISLTTGVGGPCCAGSVGGYCCCCAAAARPGRHGGMVDDHRLDRPDIGRARIAQSVVRQRRLGAALNAAAASGSRSRLMMKANSASAMVATGVLIGRLLQPSSYVNPHSS